jgi:hypothetical protein
MNKSNTDIEIIIKLANGIDPITGEILPDQSPYNNPIIIRSLFNLLKIKTSQTKSKQINTKYKNAGLPWNDELENDLLAIFKEGKTITELSNYFERSEGAITSKLSHLGIKISYGVSTYHLENIARNEEYQNWKQYCILEKSNINIKLDEREDEEEGDDYEEFSEVIEYDKISDESSQFQEEHSQSWELIIEEMEEEADNYASSDDDGWFYPDED